MGQPVGYRSGHPAANERAAHSRPDVFAETCATGLFEMTKAFQEPLETVTYAAPSPVSRDGTVSRI